MNKNNNKFAGLNIIIKWPGGKEKELKQILENIPQNFETFYDPFVGGGSVYLAIAAKKYLINDLSSELIDLYKCIQIQDTNFFEYVEAIDKTWHKIEQFFNSHENYFINLYKHFRQEANDNLLLKSIDKFINDNKEEILGVLVLIDYNSNLFLNEIKKNVKSKISRMRKIESEKGILNGRDLVNNLLTSLKKLSLYVL